MLGVQRDEARKKQRFYQSELNLQKLTLTAIAAEQLVDRMRPKCNKECVTAVSATDFFLYAECNNRIKTDGV